MGDQSGWWFISAGVYYLLVPLLFFFFSSGPRSHPKLCQGSLEASTAQLEEGQATQMSNQDNQT